MEMFSISSRLPDSLQRAVAEHARDRGVVPVDRFAHVAGDVGAVPGTPHARGIQGGLGGVEGLRTVLVVAVVSGPEGAGGRVVAEVFRRQLGLGNDRDALE